MISNCFLSHGMVGCLGMISCWPGLFFFASFFPFSSSFAYHRLRVIFCLFFSSSRFIFVLLHMHPRHDGLGRDPKTTQIDGGLLCFCFFLFFFFILPLCSEGIPEPSAPLVTQFLVAPPSLHVLFASFLQHGAASKPGASMKTSIVPWWTSASPSVGSDSILPVSSLHSAPGSHYKY